MSEYPGHRLTWGLCLLALGMFSPLFVLRSTGPLDFWWWMSGNALILLVLVGVLDPSWRKSIVSDFEERVGLKLLLGVLSAVGLYAGFVVGNELARWMFSFASEGIDQVYGFKADASIVRVSVLIALLIGPGEEFFWRLFLQRRLAARHGRWWGLALATFFYTIMHLGSFNPILILAALICGLFWGLVYMCFRSLIINVVSHVLWDLAIFVFFPLG